MPRIRLQVEAIDGETKATTLYHAAAQRYQLFVSRYSLDDDTIAAVSEGELVDGVSLPVSCAPNEMIRALREHHVQEPEKVATAALKALRHGQEFRSANDKIVVRKI